MRSTRILTVEDTHHIISLYKEIEKWKSPYQPIEKFDFFTNEQNVKNVLTDKNATYIGTFENDELIASLRMSWWTTLPCWSLANVVTKIRTFSINLEKNGIAETMSFAIKIAEDRQCYRFFTAIPDRQVNQFLFDQWIKYVPELEDYLYVIEGEFDHTESSKHIVMDVLLKSALIPNYETKYVIRSATATNKRRNFKILERLTK